MGENVCKGLTPGKRGRFAWVWVRVDRFPDMVQSLYKNVNLSSFESQCLFGKLVVFFIYQQGFKVLCIPLFIWHVVLLAS